jgi:hypothetical protein
MSFMELVLELAKKRTQAEDSGSFVVLEGNIAPRRVPVTPYLYG